LSVAAALGGCGDVSMTQQKKYGTYEPAALWADGTSARHPPDHTVTVGLDSQDSPPQIDRTLLKRGQERFQIFCSPCHGLDGRGHGMVVERGFPTAPSYLEPRLLAAPAQTFYDAITQGYGVMYSYADRVAPHDRWAIIAYIRALQLAQHATTANAPESSGMLK
jgi:mono/diheme cytochrome c family protein